jgi:hypothetical protein
MVGTVKILGARIRWYHVLAGLGLLLFLGFGLLMTFPPFRILFDLLNVKWSLGATSMGASETNNYMKV